jgi:hypothetical protein
MEGKKIRLEKVICPEEIEPVEKEEVTPGEPGNQKVISLADLKKKQS